ncbi:MAG: hypothetical protein RR657_05105 [Peptostreptococcaceae bacterium]
MKEIIYTLIGSILIVLGMIGLIYLIIKQIYNKINIYKFFRVTEMSGYILLFISLIFGAIYFMIVEMDSDSDNLIINSKLDSIISIQKEMLSDSDTNDKLTYYYKQDSYLKSLNKNIKFKEQVETVKVINLIGYIISTILISTGRVGDLMNDMSKKDKVINK